MGAAAGAAVAAVAAVAAGAAGAAGLVGSAALLAGAFVGAAGVAPEEHPPISRVVATRMAKKVTMRRFTFLSFTVCDRHTRGFIPVG